MHKIAAELRHRELTQEIYNIGDGGFLIQRGDDNADVHASPRVVFSGAMCPWMAAVMRKPTVPAP